MLLASCCCWWSATQRGYGSTHVPQPFCLAQTLASPSLATSDSSSTTIAATMIVLLLLLLLLLDSAVAMEGGTPAGPNEFPWAVMVRSGAVDCAGALIAPQWVLTVSRKMEIRGSIDAYCCFDPLFTDLVQSFLKAAHCFFNPTALKGVAFVGIDNW